jgi:predicted nucleotidyltransferase
MSGSRQGLLLEWSNCRAVTVKGVAMVASPLLDELRERLAGAFGDRLRGVVLFGSEARGEAGPESDVDLLVVLHHLSADYGDELERGLVAVYPVALRLGRRVSVKPLDVIEYESGDSPLLREVRRTGVAV